jgi:hypothetical protein
MLEGGMPARLADGPNGPWVNATLPSGYERCTDLIGKKQALEKRTPYRPPPYSSSIFDPQNDTCPNSYTLTDINGTKYCTDEVITNDITQCPDYKPSTIVSPSPVAQTPKTGAKTVSKDDMANAQNMLRQIVGNKDFMTSLNPAMIQILKPHIEMTDTIMESVKALQASTATPSNDSPNDSANATQEAGAIVSGKGVMPPRLATPGITKESFAQYTSDKIIIQLLTDGGTFLLSPLTEKLKAIKELLNPTPDPQKIGADKYGPSAGGGGRTRKLRRKSRMKKRK